MFGMEKKVKLNKRNQITIPIEIRREYGLERGDKIIFEKADDEFVLRFVKKPTADSVKPRFDHNR